MASEIDKWAKRACYPVELVDGEKGYVRKMSLGQLRAQKKLDDEDKTFYILACCLCSESGIPLITRDKTEEVSAFVARAIELLDDFSQDNIQLAMNAVYKISNPPDQDTLVKN